MIPTLAAHFFAASLLTLLLPVGLLVAVGLYGAYLIRRRAPGARTGKTE
jgi:hypothetical protein